MLFLQSLLMHWWMRQRLTWIELLTTHSWGLHLLSGFQTVSRQMVPSSLWRLQFLMTNCIHLLWCVVTPIDLAGKFLFQGFIHQPMWIRRTFNGEFIMMRNLWVAVIKFVLAFIESFITHPFLKTIDTNQANLPTSGLLLCCAMLAVFTQICYLIHFNLGLLSTCNVPRGSKPRCAVHIHVLATGMPSPFSS